MQYIPIRAKRSREKSIRKLTLLSQRFCRAEKAGILKCGIGKLGPWSAGIKDGIEFMEGIIVSSYKNSEVNVGSACIKRGDVRHALSSLRGRYFLPYI